jgi:hypothetical protein
MQKLSTISMSCAFALVALSSASATLPAPAYVDAQNGTDTGTCPITAPCATLNYALSVISNGGIIYIVKPGVFGPIVLTGDVVIAGLSPDHFSIIAADPTASVGCIGHLPGSCGLPNNGYAVEINAGTSSVIKLNTLLLETASGSGALKFTAGHDLNLTHLIFRGTVSATGPIVALYPGNPGTTQANVFFTESDIGYNGYPGGNIGAGAVELKPTGDTSLATHFYHNAVHNAAYGIRSDGSLLASSSDTVQTFISDCQFFKFQYAAMNGYSTSGTGMVQAVFESTRILGAGVALKGNGPQTEILLSGNTAAGNNIGVQILNGADITTFGNNAIAGNGTDVNGTMNTRLLQ